MIYRLSKFWAALAVSILAWGCASTNDYGNPQAMGKVPMQAQGCGVGCAGDGSRLTLGVRASQPGSFILVAGDTPILTQTVSANDMVLAEVDHPLFGQCHIAVKVNGIVMEHADSKIAVYRAYFLPAGIQTSMLPLTSAEIRSWPFVHP